MYTRKSTEQYSWKRKIQVVCGRGKKAQRCGTGKKEFFEEQLCESSSWFGRKTGKDFVVLFSILS